MKGQKDIFDHIKDNQHKLDERPRRELWDRLENRLDETDQKAAPVRSILYRRLSLVAAVLALGGLFSLVSLLLQNNNNQNMATAESFATPKQWEDLATADNEKGWHKYADFQRRINTNPSITEGAPHKKLVAQAHFSGRYQDTRFANDVRSDSNNRTNVQTPSASAPIAEANISAQENISSYSTSTSESVEEIQETPMTMVEGEVEADMVILEEEEMAEEAAKVASKPAPSEKDVHVAQAYAKKEAQAEALAKRKMSARKKQSDEARKAKEYAAATAQGKVSDSYNTRKNKMAVEANDQIGLNQFKWLLGQWTANDQHASIEAWKMVDEFTIEGKGFLVINGDTTFTEGMTIQKIDQDLYYVLALDQTGTTVKYKLKTYTEQEAVFENTEIAFPNLVILRKNNTANYSTILQNTSPVQINEQQQNYFQNRNVIRKEQVKRVMRRMK